jgi:ankyrin repeat protein
MKSYGADMSVCDYDRRTPLHVAASEGDVEMVQYLMKVKCIIY